MLVAEGRFISKRVSVDRRHWSLSSDTHRMLFLMTIPHLDRDGRITGDAYELIATIAPPLIAAKDFDAESFVADLERVGLAKLYTAECGNPVLWFPRFLSNQKGLRRDREAPSKYSRHPDDTPDPEDSGVGPENSPLSKGKLSKEKGRGVLAPEGAAQTISDKIDRLLSRYPDASLLAEARRSCELYRKTGSMSDSVWLKTLQRLERHPVDAVIRGCRVFVDRYGDGDKNENYLVGIVRGEAVDFGKNKPAAKKKTDGEISLEALKRGGL